MAKVTPLFGLPQGAASKPPTFAEQSTGRRLYRYPPAACRLELFILLFSPLSGCRELVHILVRHGTDSAELQTRLKATETDVVIYLDEYRKAKAAHALAQHSRYSEELLCVNWNPPVSTAVLFPYQGPQALSPELPYDFASIDIDAFIERVYGLASQI